MGVEVIIRKMCEQDILAVHEIECSIFTKPWSEKGFRDSYAKVNNVYLVAEVENNIVAYCGFWGVAGEGQITNVAVHKGYRRQGIAEKMMSELIDQGRKQGIEAFTLEVRVNNQAAIFLYHRLGFKDSGIRKNFYEAPVEDALIMWL